MDSKKVWENPEVVEIMTDDGAVLCGVEIGQETSGVILQSVGQGGIAYMADGSIVAFDASGNLIH